MGMQHSWTTTEPHPNWAWWHNNDVANYSTQHSLSFMHFHRVHGLLDSGCCLNMRSLFWNMENDRLKHTDLTEILVARWDDTSSLIMFLLIMCVDVKTCCVNTWARNMHPHNTPCHVAVETRTSDFRYWNIRFWQTRSIVRSVERSPRRDSIATCAQWCALGSHGDERRIEDGVGRD